MYAAANGKCDVVTELISLGADVDIQTNVSHFLCLIMIQDLQMYKSAQFDVKSLCIHLSQNCLCKLFIQLPHMPLMAYFPYGTYN